MHHFSGLEEKSMEGQGIEITTTTTFNNRLLKVKEVAAILNHSELTIKRYIREGRIKRTRVLNSRSVLVEQQEVERIIREGRNFKPKSEKSRKADKRAK
jgi:excisionase family DNA binding protein